MSPDIRNALLAIWPRFSITATDWSPSRTSAFARDDRRPGLRTIGFRRRVVIAFAVTEEAVEVLGVYYGGRDDEALIAAELE